MPVMDEFRQEREAIKNADKKTKWNYFWDYYRGHVSVGAFILFLVGFFVYSIVTAKETAFYGYFINTYADTSKSETFVAEFAPVAGIDPNEYHILIDTSLQISEGLLDETSISSVEKISTTIAASEIDFIAGDEETFLQYYANTDYCFDLREIYAQKELEKFEGYIYYVDLDEIRRKEQFIESQQLEQYVAKEYDHFAPEQMGDPVPIGLCIQDCPKLKEIYYFQDGLVPMGIVINTQRLDTTLQFIDYIFEDLIVE